jgi:galactokinase
MGRDAFVRIHHEQPSAVVKAPGRVNLIGEHTDYSLLPVMPVAIDKAVLVAAAPGPERRLVADSEAFPERLDVSTDELPVRPVGWHRYLLAVVRVLSPSPRGARLVVSGDLPATGGLSSSSALAVGVLDALNRVWDLGIDRTDYPALAIAAERSIGVEGGTMDQTIISLAEPGSALRIDFDPPARRVVPIPPELALVAAYSGSEAPKGGAANLAYNTRVVACRAAALLLGVPAGLDVGRPPVLSRVASHPVAPASLPEETTAAEVADRLGVDVELMVGLTAGRFDPDSVLPVRVVATHVLSEAERVDEAEHALATADLVRLGSVLDASHASLKGFGASSPALDRLVEAMRKAGAWGARLTGAGFGGYAVGVCPPDRVDGVVSAAVEATGGPAFPVVASGGVGPA